MSAPTFTPGDLDASTGVFMKLTGTAAPGDSVAFDSVLKRSLTPAHNHTLQINLRIFLHKVVPPLNMKIGFATDYDHKLFVTGPWSNAEWMRFTQGFLRQCDMWNDKFWLIPPASFNQLDIKSGARTFRPNVWCRLNVELAGSAATAHRSIDVVNIDAKWAARMYGGTESDVNRGTFRSDSGDYDTFDVRPHVEDVTIAGGTTVKATHYTIAHEIGHAIGQDHIGVVREDPACRVAMIMDEHTPDMLKFMIPGVLRSGPNSQVCYGEFSSAAVGKNVMGGGGEFEAANAKPWQDLMPIHSKDPDKWTVSMTRVPPKVV
jgi:hypothetical protein